MIERKYTEAEDKQRRQIIGILEDREYRGGVISFNNLSAEALAELIFRGYADPDDAQNYSPTIGEFLDFLSKHPEFHAHGYMVSNDRDDRRISIEGLESNDNVDLDKAETIIENWLQDTMFIEPDDFGVYGEKVWILWD